MGKSPPRSKSATNRSCAMRTRHLGCSLTSVSATVPESKSSEPPLEFSTCAMAFRVKAAQSPLKLPRSLKSCSVTLGEEDAGEFAPASAGNSRRAHETQPRICLESGVFMMVFLLKIRAAHSALFAARLCQTDVKNLFVVCMGDLSSLSFHGDREVGGCITGPDHVPGCELLALLVKGHLIKTMNLVSAGLIKGKPPFQVDLVVKYFSRLKLHQATKAAPIHWIAGISLSLDPPTTGISD